MSEGVGSMAPLQAKRYQCYSGLKEKPQYKPGPHSILFARALATVAGKGCQVCTEAP